MPPWQGAQSGGAGANNYYRPYVQRYYAGPGCVNIAQGGGGGNAPANAGDAAAAPTGGLTNTPSSSLSSSPPNLRG
jgi:hypothetical protein